MTEPARSELDKKVIAMHPVKVKDPLNLEKQAKASTTKDHTKMAGYHDGQDKKAYEKIQPDPGPMKYRSFMNYSSKVANGLTGGNDVEYQHYVHDMEDHPLFEAWASQEMFESWGATVEINEEALAEGAKPHRVAVHVFNPEAAQTGRQAQARVLRTMAKDAEEAVENAQTFYKHNGFKKVDVIDAMQEEVQLDEAKTREASKEDASKFYKASSALRNAVKANMHDDGRIKDFGVHHELVGKHADLMRKHGLFVHKGKLRKYVSEEAMNEARTFPLTTAQWRANKNTTASMKAGTDRDADRHARAAERYQRIAKGKKPFREELEELDEISKHTLHSYLNKATDDRNAARDLSRGMAQAGIDKIPTGMSSSLTKKEVDHLDKKRSKGIKQAIRRISEEVELAEASTQTTREWSWEQHAATKDPKHHQLHADIHDTLSHHHGLEAAVHRNKMNDAHHGSTAHAVHHADYQKHSLLQSFHIQRAHDHKTWLHDYTAKEKLK